MQIKEEITYPEVREILENETISDEKKILKLKKMYLDELAIQRIASEAPTDVEDTSGPRIQHLTNVLRAYDVDVSSFAENAATL